MKNLMLNSSSSGSLYSPKFEVDSAQTAISTDLNTLAEHLEAARSLYFITNNIIIIIITIIIYSFESFSLQRKVMVFHCDPSDSKSTQVTRTP